MNGSGQRSLVGMRLHAVRFNRQRRLTKICIMLLLFFQDETSVTGTVTGSTIRTVLLRHDLASSKGMSYWHMRGGGELAFSVWDDDIAGVRRMVVLERMKAHIGLVRLRL